MSVYNIFQMASGEELGRYFAVSAQDALNAMARDAGYADFEAVCGSTPQLREQILITQL